MTSSKTKSPIFIILGDGVDLKARRQGQRARQERPDGLAPLRQGWERPGKDQARQGFDSCFHFIIFLSLILRRCVKSPNEESPNAESPTSKSPTAKCPNNLASLSSHKLPGALKIISPILSLVRVTWLWKNGHVSELKIE